MITTPSIDAALRQALAQHQAGRLEQAVPLYRQVLAAAPGLAGVHSNLGIALARLGRLGEAVESHRRAVSLAPEQADLHVNLANVLHAGGQSAEAAACYRRALAIAPDDAGALYNLGSLLLRETALDSSGGRIAESFSCLARHARLAYASAADPMPPPHKLRHDREQQDYLAGRDGAGRKFHLADGGALSGPAVSPGDPEQIARQWRTQKPQIIVIDNLLTQEALEKLRHFCWGSTIWRNPHPDGYLTALPEHGLACPLLAQIAQELRDAHPAIFRSHPLRYLWAFKYDSGRSGVAVHADQAAVNVNFWITPDEANRDPETGGLVVWDAAAPLDWNFSRYNGDAANARAFLARMGAKPTRIPHRANRAVIFDSDLFHETDRMAFGPGYLDRRINVTLLYGVRAAG